MKIGKRTKFGKVVAIANIKGERYYFCINKHGVVSMMPEGSFDSQTNKPTP